MNVKFEDILDKNIIKEAPLFYSFLRKTSKEVNDKIELGDFKLSSSTVHRSATYMVFGNYKPNSKLNIAKVFGDEE